MATKPEYNVGDVVYLRSSAAIGRLDPFKISGIKQTQQGRWIYRIDIFKKPPHRQLLGDTYDGRLSEPSIFYTSEEFIDQCEGLDLMVYNLERQIASVESQMVGVCDEADPAPEPGDSKFSIEDRIFIDASARLGFFEQAVVAGINVRPIQPGSNKYRYTYKLSLQGHVKEHLVFRESELTTFCDAANKILDSLNRQLADAAATRQQVCGTTA
jgi:hypothetical protein